MPQSTPYNRPLEGTDRFHGPVDQRKCTDVFWLILFLISNIVLIALGIYAFLDGDAERLLHGSDFRGELCGVDDLSGKEYLYWPKPESDVDLKL
jgi:hypothetical protein